jgi:CubicO group peptidase (beta-lactamase class C family)
MSTPLHEAMTAQHIPALSVRVLRGSEVLESHDLGLIDLEHQTPNTPAAVFEIASVTKLFTTQVVLRLAQDGALDLDAPLIGALPDLVPSAWQAVTARHVLMHQSGLPSYTEPAAYWATTQHDKTPAEVLALVADQPLRFEPTTRYAYDNTGFYLLGLLIERVTGQTYADQLQRVIFAPLGMTSTRANDYAALIPQRARGYNVREGVLVNKPYYSPSNTFSAGCVVSTADDLVRWRRSLFDDSVLGGAMRRAWWSLNPSGEGNEGKGGFTLGLGWFSVTTPLGQMWGHNGGIQGFASAWMYFPEGDITAVVLCNSGAVDAPHTLAFPLVQAVLGR